MYDYVYTFLLRSNEWKSFAEHWEIRETAGFDSTQITQGRWAEETHLQLFKDQGDLRETLPDPRLSGVHWWFRTHTMYQENILKESGIS